MKKILFSGIQPSGDMHIGNFLGTMQNWKNFQDLYQSYFCIVDYHALTVNCGNINLWENSLRSMAFFLACDLDPKQAIIFRQSDVPQHAELMWLFSCFVQKNLLSHMIQFKEKSQQNNNISVGLYTYPLLMAADILLYKAKFIPVGADQMQHLELTKQIAQKFNTLFKINFFEKIETFIPETSSRIMSLQDGAKKMSKSDPANLSCIFLADDPDVIKKKINRAKTDSEIFIHLDHSKQSPEIKNLINIFLAFDDEENLENSLQKIEGKKYGEFKKIIIDVVVNKLTPVREKFHNFMNNQDYLLKILNDGAEKARAMAEINIKQIKEIMRL